MILPFKRISIIGLGYIGLPTAAVLASRGVQVIGVDVNDETVHIINDGKIHIVEPGLDIVVHGAVESGMLRAVAKPEHAEAFLVAVPTPTRDSHRADLSYIEAAAGSIAPVLEKGNLVILESTSPVGTTEQLSQWLAESRLDLTFPHQAGEKADIMLAYCPERVLPGKMLRELIENDRIIGGMSQRSTERAVELYRMFVEGECLTTDVRTAEMVKLVENAYRDVNIAFANELSLIADQLGINVWELLDLANHHPRVNILQPGPGVGGHCIAVDPWFIVESAPELAHLIRTARQVNDHKPYYIVDQIKQAAARYEEPVIACLGLAYKANVDDLRESPAVEIVAALAEQKVGQVLAVEPHIEELPPILADLDSVKLVGTEAALVDANVIALLVNHRQFLTVDWSIYSGREFIDISGHLSV